MARPSGPTTGRTAGRIGCASTCPGGGIHGGGTGPSGPPANGGGIIPGGGATARLPRIVGRGWGMEMMLMGEPIDADRALQMGLVTRLVDSAELLNEVTRMAQHLASFAPFVPRTMKAMVHFGMEASLAGALMFEKYAQGALVQTEDKAEGIAAFLEKRTPEFKGK